MKDIREIPAKKQGEYRDDATMPFLNSEKDSAAETNRGGDKSSRNYMGKKGEANNGPNFDKKSKGVDGDSGQNAGVFK